MKAFTVTGLHKASMLDSYHDENHSPLSRRCGITEKSTTRTSSIRKMWQDLESEGKCETIESEETLIDTNEIENQNQNQIAVHNTQEDENKPRLHRSPSLDVPEKERVRKVFRDWGSKSFEGLLDNCSRENEYKRVRIELSGQQATHVGSLIEKVKDGSVNLGVGEKRPIRRIYGRQALLDLLAKFVRERKREVDSLLENQFVSNFAHRHRIQSLLKGRFLRNKRFVEDEKPSSVAASELGLLRQTHAVSDIRKGFLSILNNYNNIPEIIQSDSENEIKYEQAKEIPDEISDKFKTNNLTSNREAHNPQQFASPIEVTHYPQSDSDTDTDTDNHTDMKYDNIEKAEEIVHKIPHERENLSELPQVVCLHPLQTSTDSLNWQEVSQAEKEWEESVTEDDENEWHHLTRTDSDEGIDVISPLRSDSQESHDEWFGGNYSYQEPTPAGTRITFYWSDDDDNDNNRSELTEITNRRTVSNLLQSDFGARLEQLMQSYVDRQNQGFESENEGDETETVDSNSPSVVIPETPREKEIINGLRIDMDKLQERMNDMQRMLEACMDMQHELQKSVHQELHSALNRSNSGGAYEDDRIGNYDGVSSPEKKGVCYLCRDDDFESLPNRSGAYMYICSQCAEKINWSKVKESVR